MPVYYVEHQCPRGPEGYGGFRFFHERQDAISADCPTCGENLPATIEVKENP